MKPSYCTIPNLTTCANCALVNYGRDCHNNPIQDNLQIIPCLPDKYQMAYNLINNVPSAKRPHLDALDSAGLIEALEIDQIVVIVNLMQTAYHNGCASMGAQLVDNDAVHIDGIGLLERQPSGDWKLTMPFSIAGQILGKVTSERKKASSRINGRKGGRPPKS